MPPKFRTKTIKTKTSTYLYTVCKSSSYTQNLSLKQEILEKSYIKVRSSGTISDFMLQMLNITTADVMSLLNWGGGKAILFWPGHAINQSFWTGN